MDHVCDLRVLQRPRQRGSSEAPLTDRSSAPVHDSTLKHVADHSFASAIGLYMCNTLTLKQWRRQPQISGGSNHVSLITDEQ